MPRRALKARIVDRLSRMPVACRVTAEGPTPLPPNVRPTTRVWAGLVLIGVSYVIGWPAVGLLALIALHLGEALVVVIGGPVVYGLSHLVFLAGFYLAGARYAPFFFRWAARKVLAKTGNCTTHEPPVGY